MGPRVLQAIALLIFTVGPSSSADPPHRSAQVLSTARSADGRGCTSYGTGLAVGGGLVLTAAHVLLQPVDLGRVCGFADATAAVRVDVTLGAGPHTAEIVAQGRRIETPTMHFAGSGDFAILRIAVPMHSPLLAPCTAAPQPGQHVAIVTRRGVLPARVAARQTPKQGDDSAYLDLDRVVDNGDSGAGVLDAASGCILGLVSHRFPEPEPAVTRITAVWVFADAWRAARGR